jgi:type IX secretion system PorP/SprF family membrane protein
MKLKFLFLLFFIELISFAQDPASSQFFFNQLYVNPAFAGINNDLRAGLNYRRQWLKIPSKFETYNFWGDIYVPSYHGGLGIIANQDVSGEGFLKTTSLGIIQSFEFTIPKIINFRTGFNISGVSKTIDINRLEFTDQFDPVLGKIYRSNIDRSYTAPRNFIDISSGFTLQLMPIKKREYEITNMFGYSVSHINEPNESLSGAENKFLPRKHTFHVTLNFQFGSGQGKNPNLSKTWRICPNFIYERQGNTTENGSFFFARKAQFSTISFGVYTMLDPFIGGLFFRKKKMTAARDNDCVAILVGLKKTNGNNAIFRISYSYDITISNLASNTAGTHEVSCYMEFKNHSLINKKRKKRKQSQRIIDCSHFGMKNSVF